MTAQAQDDIGRALAGIRATIEQRVADRAEQAKAKVGIRDLASFDMAGLAARLRPLLEKDGRGWGKIALDAGVTTPDLSRAMSGQPVSAAKVFALCDWAGLEARAFYHPPRKRRFASRRAPAAAPPAVPAGRGGRSAAPDEREAFAGRPAADVFHVAPTETAKKAVKQRRRR